MLLPNLSLSLGNQSVSSGSGAVASGGEAAGGKTEAGLFGQLLRTVQGEGGKDLPPAAVAERLGISLEQLQQLLAQLGQEVAQQGGAAPAAVAGDTTAAASADAPPAEDAEAFLLWLANQQQSLTPASTAAGEFAAASPLASSQGSTQPASASETADGQGRALAGALAPVTVAPAPVASSPPPPLESSVPGAAAKTQPRANGPEPGSAPVTGTASASADAPQPHIDQSTTDNAAEPLGSGQQQRTDEITSRPPAALPAPRADTPPLAADGQDILAGGQGTRAGGQPATASDTSTASRAELAAVSRLAEAPAATPQPPVEISSEPPLVPSAGAQPGAATPEPVTASTRPGLAVVASNSAPLNPQQPSPLPAESSAPAVGAGSEEPVAVDIPRPSVPAKVQDERLFNALEQQSEAQQEASAEQQEADPHAAEQLLQLAAGRNGERAPADGQRGQQWQPLWQQFNLAPDAEAQAASAADTGGEQLTAVAPSVLSAGDNRTLASLQQRQSDNQPSPLLRHFAADPASALGNQLQLLVARNLDQITVRLDPQELGSMTIQLRLSEQQLNVQFQVANPHTRELVEQALPRLREMLGEAGIQLGNTQVGQQQQRDPQQLAGDGQPRQSSGGGDKRMAGDEERAADSQRQRLPRSLNVAPGRLDFYV